MCLILSLFANAATAFKFKATNSFRNSKFYATKCIVWQRKCRWTSFTQSVLLEHDSRTAKNQKYETKIHTTTKTRKRSGKVIQAERTSYFRIELFIVEYHN